MTDMKVLAIIPARGGSKRFPGKNLHPLMGKPLIAHPIDAAKKARLVERVVVSTDSQEIADAARRAGAEVPFLRPAELAGDRSSVIDAIIYTVEELARRDGYAPDYTVVLQPTTPIIGGGQIDNGIGLVVRHGADSAVAVAEVNTINHPYNIRAIREDGTVGFWQEKLHYDYYTVKQKPKFYHAANMWITSRRTLLEERRIEGARNLPLIADPIYASDIDYKSDLLRIEAYLEYLQRHGLSLP